MQKVTVSYNELNIGDRIYVPGLSLAHKVVAKMDTLQSVIVVNGQKRIKVNGPSFCKLLQVTTVIDSN